MITGKLYSAEEARALREGRESTGAWDAGHDTCPRHRGDAANQRIRCECRAVALVFKDGDRALCAAAPDLAATAEHLHAERREAMRRIRVVLAHFGVDDCDDPLAALEEMPERSDAVVADEVARSNELTLQVAALRAERDAALAQAEEITRALTTLRAAVHPTTGGAWHEGAAVYLRADAHTPCAMAVNEDAARRIVLALNSLPVTP